MELIDVTLPMHENMTVYEGDAPYQCWRFRAVPEDGYQMCLISFSSHCGTHVDAPAHFVDGGGGVTDLSLETMCGSARVIDVRSAGLAISADVLRQQKLDGVERLLLKTVTGKKLRQPFDPEYAHLTVDAAKYLVERTGIRLIGLDSFSVEKCPVEGFPVHNTLLGTDPPTVIVEAIDLEKVEAGDYHLICLPLALRGADGAPARVVLGR
jgi:arylformamidase